MDRKTTCVLLILISIVWVWSHSSIATCAEHHDGSERTSLGSVSSSLPSTAVSCAHKLHQTTVLSRALVTMEILIFGALVAYAYVTRIR